MSDASDRLAALGMNADNGIESMRLINWGFARAPMEEVRRAMGLHAIADVVRAGVATVSYGVLELQSISADGDRISLLDGYEDPDAPETPEMTVVRFKNLDLVDADAAARACGLTFEEFGRRATLFIMDMERKKPGFLARAKAVDAQEDIAGRRALWATDIQPWGDQNYRDYGVPDDD